MACQSPGNAGATSSDTSLKALLAQFAVEIHHAAERLAAIEVAISDMSDHVVGLELESMQNIQQIDKIRQSLEALSGCAADVSRQIPDALLVDCGEAVGRIKLAALAERLRTGMNDTTVVKPVAEGELDLFV